MLGHALFFDSFRRRLAVNAAPAFSLRVWICQMSCQVGVDHGEQFPFLPGNHFLLLLVFALRHQGDAAKIGGTEGR